MGNNILNLLKPILIIDNNEDDFKALALAFEKTGLPNPLSHCKTGHEAMDCLNQTESKTPFKPVMILLDPDLPDIDGLRLLQIIREAAELQKTPIVIWASSAHERDINSCYYNGAHAYMRKPDSFEDMLESVRRLKEYWFETVILPSGGGIKKTIQERYIG